MIHGEKFGTASDSNMTKDAARHIEVDDTDRATRLGSKPPREAVLLVSDYHRVPFSHRNQTGEERGPSGLPVAR